MSTGTSSPAPTTSKRSGFLSNYDLLKPIEGGDGAQSWRRADWDAPGPDVIGIRFAIVDIVPTTYAPSIAGTLTPYAFVAEAASGPASGRPAGSTPYLGETSIEAKFLDGASGQLLGEFADTRIGKKYDIDTSKSTKDMAKKMDERLHGFLYLLELCKKGL